MSESSKMSPAEIRAHHAMIRKGTRERLRKVLRATVRVVEPIYSDALCTGKRSRHDWAVVMEVLREKKDQLETVIQMYKPPKKAKREEAKST